METLMHITHSKKSAACYIRLLPEGTPVHRSDMLSDHPWVVVDRDDKLGVIGIEVLEDTGDSPTIEEIDDGEK